MSKAKIIGQIRIAAERDLTISDGAMRLLYRICSHIYTNPRATLEKAFPLTWRQAAEWCGIKEPKASARRIAELVDAGYLKCDGLRGCPPRNYFFLISNYGSKAVIDYGSRGATDYGSRGADHISNSFQEEKIKGKREENGSLRSTGTRDEELKAAQARTGEAQKETLARLRKSLAPVTVARS